jgi:hypothetical protein
MIRGSIAVEFLGLVAGDFAEPIGVRNIASKHGSRVHDENWYPEGQNDGEWCDHDPVELPVSDNFLRL